MYIYPTSLTLKPLARLHAAKSRMITAYQWLEGVYIMILKSSWNNCCKRIFACICATRYQSSIKDANMTDTHKHINICRKKFSRLKQDGYLKVKIRQDKNLTEHTCCYKPTCYTDYAWITWNKNSDGIDWKKKALSTVIVCATLVLSEPSIWGKWLICSGLFLSISFTCTLSLYAAHTESNIWLNHRPHTVSVRCWDTITVQTTPTPTQCPFFSA